MVADHPNGWPATHSMHWGWRTVPPIIGGCNHPWSPPGVAAATPKGRWGWQRPPQNLTGGGLGHPRWPWGGGPIPKGPCPSTTSPSMGDSATPRAFCDWLATLLIYILIFLSLWERKKKKRKVFYENFVNSLINSYFSNFLEEYLLLYVRI